MPLVRAFWYQRLPQVDPAGGTADAASGNVADAEDTSKLRVTIGRH